MHQHRRLLMHNPTRYILLLIAFLLGLSLAEQGCKCEHRKDPQPEPTTPRQDTLSNLTSTATDVANPHKSTPLSVINEAGEIATVILPPGAVDSSLTLFIHTTSLAIDPSFGRIVFAGLEIQPSGMHLNRPLLVHLRLAPKEGPSSQIRLYQLGPDGTARILTRQTVTDSTIDGYLTSTYPCFAAIATSSTVVTLAADYSANQVFENPDEMKQTVEEMIELGSLLKLIGRGAEGQSLLDGAWICVEHDLSAILNEPIPDDPCSEYLTTLLQYAGVASAFKVGNDVTASFGNRIQDVLKRCPIKGHLTYYAYTIPSLYYLHAEGVIPFYTTDAGLLGESQNGLIMGSQKMIQNGMSAWVDGNGLTTFDITGTFEVTPFLEPIFRIKAVSKPSYMKMDCFGESAEAGLVHLMSFEFKQGSQVDWGVGPGLFFWGKGSTDSMAWDLTFDYQNGAQFIKRSGNEVIELFEVWTMDLETEPATVFVTGVKPLTMKSVLADGESLEIALTAYGNPPGGKYTWSIPSGSSKVSVVGGTDGQNLRLEPISESIEKGDIEAKVEYQTSKGNANYSVQLTSHIPKSLRVLSKNTTYFHTDSCGYKTLIQYMVLDQFGDRFPLGRLCIDEDLIPIYNPSHTNFDERRTVTDDYSIFPDGLVLSFQGQDGVPTDYEASVRQVIRAAGYEVLDHVLVWNWLGVTSP